MSDYALRGQNLDDQGKRWLVMEGTSLPGFPTPRLRTVEVPYRGGVLPLPTVAQGSSLVTIAFLVKNCKWGGVPGGRRDLDENWRSLLRLINTAGDLPIMTYAPGNGQDREARVRLVSLSDPIYNPTDLHMQATAVFEAVDGVWRDKWWGKSAHTDLAFLGGGVMPVYDAQFLIDAQGSNVVVEDVVSGKTMTWRGLSAPSTGHLLIDAGDCSAGAVAEDTWTGGGELSRFLNLPVGGFPITPDPVSGKSSLKVTGGACMVRAKRAFL